MGYADFLEYDQQKEKNKAEREKMEDAHMPGLHCYPDFTFSVCVSSNFGAFQISKHQSQMFELDEEDMAYFRAKAKRLLEKERNEELEAVNKRFDEIKNQAL